MLVCNIRRYLMRWTNDIYLDRQGRQPAQHRSLFSRVLSLTPTRYAGAYLPLAPL
jgi:hypothetical protein